MSPRRLHPRNLRLARQSLAATDAQLARVIATHGTARIRPAPQPDPFRSLIRSIIYQQLSGKAAASIHQRFLQLFEAGGPTPADLAATAPERLREAGLSAAKTRALHDLATHYAERRLPEGQALARMSDEDIIQSFIQVRGVGRWTVEMMLIFELGRPDVLPLTDLGVRRGWMYLRGAAQLPEAEELRADGERWQPWRSVAAWYLWRASEAPPPL